MKILAKNYDKNWTQKVPENAEFGATKTFNIRNFLIFELDDLRKLKFLNKMDFNFQSETQKDSKEGFNDVAKTFVTFASNWFRNFFDQISLGS